jgi:Spy/CpxP family protein refolding chaperone
MQMNETTAPDSSPNAGRPKSCRGRGRTVLFGALFLGVAAVLTAGALQALGFGPFRHGACGTMDPAQVEKKIDRIAGWIVEDLGGTPEQQAKLSAIAKAAAKDLAPVHDELVSGRRQAVEILTATQIDRAALEAHRARQMQLLTTVSERLTTAVADAAEVLTPTQRVKAADKLASHMARFGH